MAPHPSAGTIIDLSRALLREEAGSDVPVIGDTVMLQGVAKADRDALTALRRGGGNTTRERALEDGFSLASSTAVNNSSGVFTTDVTVPADSTTGFDSSGAAVFWDNDMPDIFYYTSLSSTVFSGVTGIGFAHADNTEIQALYALPSNFGMFRRSEEYGDGVQLNGDPLRYMEGPPNPGYFSLVDDGTTKYLWLNRGSVSSSGKASVWFDKDSNTIDSTDDLISLPDDWLYFYAWTVIYLSLFGRGDFAIVQMAKEEMKSELLGQLKDRNVGRRIRVRQYPRVSAFDYNLAQRENAL